MNLQKLIEEFLLEAVGLTKGSQRVMNDKKLVTGLANAVRDDVAVNPSAFPPGSKNNFKKSTDEAIAQWFLENIDQIEIEGYEGIVYSRDGVNSDWIVRRYIAGSHTWEDLTGVMNMNLCDWYLLKNRNMLDPNHKDLAKFKSVRDVGFYMTTHYKDNLAAIRDSAKNAARNKMAKNFKLVDNDDYRIYTAINRAAGCALGLGTQWCTANSNSGQHFHKYSNAAMLFQLFPYEDTINAETGETEKRLSEKYQFDTGGPNFMNITDNRANPNVIREKFPYIYDDLHTALLKNKGKMEKAFAEWANDPTLQHEDFKIKNYELDHEIQELNIFMDIGYFTDAKRPSDKIEHDEPVNNQPQIEPPQISENFRKNSKYSRFDYTDTIDSNLYTKYIMERSQTLYKHGITEDELLHGSLHLSTGLPSVAKKIRNGLSTNIFESGAFNEIDHIIRLMHDFDMPEGTDIHVGDKLSVIEFEIMVAWRQIAVSGFITPKEIVKVDTKSDGKIKRVYFSDGDSYPRTNKMSFKGRPTDYSVFFTDPELAKSAIGTIKIALPDNWALENQIKEPQMENIRQLAKAMLEDKHLGHIVQTYVPIEDTNDIKQGQDSPMTFGNDNLDEEDFSMSPGTGIEQAKQRLKDALSAKSSKIEEDDMMQDDAAAGNSMPQAQTGGALGAMGGTNSSGTTQYPPGTAPTMPESIQTKETTMENVDKDVAAMLNSLKTYDQLNESVLGMVTMTMKKPVSEAGQPWEKAEEVEEKDEGKHNNGTTTGFKAVAKNATKEYGSKEAGERVAGAVKAKMAKAGQLEEDGPKKSEVPAAFRKEKGGDWKTSKDDLEKESNSSPTTKKGLADKKEKEDIKESNKVDPDILDWMNRFSKLGNMKGYGR